MMSVGLKRKARRTIAIASTIAALAMFSSLPTLESAVAASPQADTSVVPAMPAANAPLSDWQTWASLQRQAIESANPSSLVHNSAGCATTVVTVLPVVSTGAGGIPAGIVTDALSVVGTCGSGTSGSAATGGVSPAISQYCPNMDGCNYAGATNGEVAVGTATVNGNVNYMAAAYTYTASGSGYTAHSELGTVASGCSTGSLVANSTSASLSTNQYVEVLWGPRNGSATWTSTGWHYNGSSYQDLGTVCGMW